MTVKPTIGPTRGDNYVVTNNDWNNDVVAADNYILEVLSGANADKIPPSAISGTVGYFPNMLINPGFEKWRRGTSFNATNGGSALSADRWQITQTSPSTLVVQQASSSLDAGSASSMACAYTHGTAGSAVVYQRLEDFKSLAGRTVTFSIRFNNQMPCTLSIFDGSNFYGSSSYGAGGGAFQTGSVTATLPTNLTAAQFAISFGTNTGSVYLDNAVVSISPAYVPYQPINADDELRRCERYYQVRLLTNNFYATAGGQVRNVGLNWQTHMYGTPTSTLTAGTRGNVSSAALATLTGDGAIYTLTATAAGSCFASNDTLTLDSGTF